MNFFHVKYTCVGRCISDNAAPKKEMRGMENFVHVASQPGERKEEIK